MLPLDLPPAERPAPEPVKPASARWQPDLASPLMKAQQRSEKAQAPFAFDAFDLPLFDTHNKEAR